MTKEDPSAGEADWMDKAAYVRRFPVGQEPTAREIDRAVRHEPSLTSDSGTDAAWCVVCGQRLAFIGEWVHKEDNE